MQAQKRHSRNTCIPVLLATVLVLLLAGCAATGMPAVQMQDALATLPSRMGRIVFYRDNAFAGAAVQPSILVDGTVVGESKPGCFFFSDVTPGAHEIEARTEASTRMSVSIDEGQTRYVRSAISMGIMVGRVQFTLADDTEALRQLPSLRFTGSMAGNLTGRSNKAVEPGIPPAASSMPRASSTAVSLDDLDGLLPRKP
jgi:hypothetical protein